jgi:hypothetical protein
MSAAFPNRDLPTARDRRSLRAWRDMDQPKYR